MWSLRPCQNRRRHQSSAGTTQWATSFHTGCQGCSLPRRSPSASRLDQCRVRAAWCTWYGSTLRGVRCGAISPHRGTWVGSQRCMRVTRERAVAASSIVSFFGIERNYQPPSRPRRVIGNGSGPDADAAAVQTQLAMGGEQVKVLVVGASGNIGAELCKQLRAQPNVTVYEATRKPRVRAAPPKPPPTGADAVRVRCARVMCPAGGRAAARRARSVRRRLGRSARRAADGRACGPRGGGVRRFDVRSAGQLRRGHVG
jgi:hypothetical protein